MKVTKIEMIEAKILQNHGINRFVDNLSKDMRLKYPGAKGFSV